MDSDNDVMEHPAHDGGTAHGQLRRPVPRVGGRRVDSVPRFSWNTGVLGFGREHPILTLVILLIVGLVAWVTLDEIDRVFSQNSTASVFRSTLNWFAFTSDGQLTSIGIILTILVAIAWVMSNRAEATPNLDQLEEMRQFVTGHFASYVARGLAVEGVTPDEVDVAHDSAWRRIYVQHLRLHNELYGLRPAIGLKVFEKYIDDAVRAHLTAIQKSGVHADPLVASESPA
jgi:hypothetical protein